MSRFVYQPLGRKEIRLITFEKDSNPPAFSLRHCNMRRVSKRYTCLSYCWGDILNSHLVLCNGKELRVHANLYDALIQLARRKDTQDYWIDAICINQIDLDEKGSQIQLMGQIFERAASVYVWLGTTSVTEDEDITQSPNLESPFRLLEEKEWGKIEIGELVSRGLPPLDSRFWETLGGILNRSWFRRLWVIQEITLCRSSFLLLGYRTVSFRSFYHATILMIYLCSREQTLSKLGASQAEIYSAMVARQFCGNIIRLQSNILDRPTSSLSTRTHLLLNSLREQEASHLADRVHGMLGLFKHEFVKRIAINANNTIAETYQSFAVASLLADRRLSLLHYVSPTRAVNDLPSWCPDLSRLSPEMNLGGSNVPASAKFRSGILKSRHGRISNWHKRLSWLIPRRMELQTPWATTRFLSAPNTLLVKGISIDKVARIVSDHPSCNFSSSSMAQIERWEQQCLEISQTTLKCPDIIPVPHVRTLVGSTRIQQGEGEHGDPSAAYISALEAIQSRDHRLRKFGPRFNDPGSVYLHVLVRYCEHRRFMATVGNRIGLCPPHSKQGDLICILWGARSPFVLRPVPNTENFQLLGECYVDGLMYGEAFRIKREQRLKDMMFPLI